MITVEKRVINNRSNPQTKFKKLWINNGTKIVSILPLVLIIQCYLIVVSLFCLGVIKPFVSGGIQFAVTSKQNYS